MAGEAFLVHFLPEKYPNEKKGDRWYPLAMECGGESGMMAYLWIYSIGKAMPHKPQGGNGAVLPKE